MNSPQKKERHVLGISGGKDSAALAIYLRDKVPDMEYFFTDTGAELDETLDFIERLEAYLGKRIDRLSPERDFEHFLKLYGNFLPSPRARWCTRELKLKPFEKWIGDDQVVSYVGIRADENREGYVSTKPNIKAVFPFKEDGLIKEDIFRILEESGVGVPEYYKWRSRSGCYFCFFQRKKEWIGLLNTHPELFEKAMAFEKFDEESGKRFTWNQKESLEELVARASDIDMVMNEREKKVSWQEALADEDEDDDACLICTL
ncbi:3'-phosphoadenosine 5'-phosphosulfate sulfotransferase (PAPS reductase)/FAD synthetase [Mariprofundus ferrinatatus]|uniref:3'-phosphoadenosine 5'-phosphosulfate sulfotransferase (PAPS reductase)/FAD synthetase n=1 Tax=Mariprofundus ferrinatatus TaxID=1921087 RepID=A0A2K8L9V3_9PROT|nr:phosphoadenosine phosphosulfate reductase family protein [Mariprofundus ferrinatatus]ATX81724.1 3'-phosphoadenosine 5'-phosphosulfate sulfotransferase (PAPS reductase)/FAD synthetase [Mariprofundus ferrinatatus]